VACGSGCGFWGRAIGCLRFEEESCNERETLIVGYVRPALPYNRCRESAVYWGRFTLVFNSSTSLSAELMVSFSLFFSRRANLR
jgi:hypothetical protein